MTDKPEVFRKYDIRGKTPEEIDSEIVFGVGQALGEHWKTGRVVVGRDQRRCSASFLNAIKSGLTSSGMEVLDIGLATTDMVALKTMKGDFKGGVMITASHLPPGHGGIKPLNSEGRILHNGEMEALKELYDTTADTVYSGNHSGSFKKEYIGHVVARYHELFEKDLEGVRIVVDPGNGMGGLALPSVLEELGAEATTLNSEMDPEFPGRNPEPTENNLDELQKTVIEQDADLGIATDGDADRAVFVDEKGEFVSGDESLAILAEKYLETTDSAVISINTSEMVEKHIRSLGGSVKYAPVGAVFTAVECLRNDIGFGGQPNGHLMDPNFVPYDSGTLFGAVMAGMVAEEPLSRMRAQLPAYEQDRWNIDTENKQELIESIREEAESRGWLSKDRYDTLRLETEHGSAVIRPSGSEPVVRVRIESETDIEKLSEKIKSLIKQKEKR